MIITTFQSMILELKRKISGGIMRFSFKIIAVFLMALFYAPQSFAQLGKDNGRGSDGVLIFPKKFALFCDISSTDIHTDGTVKKCLNKILRLRESDELSYIQYDPFFNEAYHQVNAEYLYKSLQQRSKSDDYKDEISKVIDDCKDNSGGAVGDAASAIGGDEDGGSKIHRRQCENVNLTALTGERIVGIIDTYSELLALRALDYYRQNEFNSNNSAKIEDEYME